MENAVEMATVGIKVENEMAAASEEVVFDLATVKRVTEQVASFGFLNVENPICEWKLENNENSQCQPRSSDFFPMDHGNMMGQLQLTREDGQFKLSLNLKDSGTGERIHSLNPFQFFICKFLLSFGTRNYEHWSWFFSINAIRSNEEKSDLNFKFYSRDHCDDDDAKTITVELYQEPLAMMEYRWPYPNMVLGKLEMFRVMNNQTDYDEFIAASPRFTFGPPDGDGQLAMVKFSCCSLPNIWNASGLCATLHVLGKGQGPPFSFTATVTLFSREEIAKDLVRKVFFRRDDHKTEFSTFLVFYHEFNTYLTKDTIYYKVEITPRPAK